ncbi:MAG: hypothetical protein Q9193_002839 [Seirophora villosa]
MTSVKHPLLRPFCTYHRPRRRNLHSSSRLRGNTHVTLSKDDYIQLLDYYLEPCNSSTTSSAACTSAPTAPSPKSIFYHPTPPASYNRPFTRPAKALESEIVSPEAVPESTSHNHDNPGVFHHQDAFPALDLAVKEAGPGPGARLPYLKRTRPALLYSEEYHGVIVRLQMLLDEEESSHEQIYEMYSQLPSPGVKYLPQEIRRQLLHRLSNIETKTRAAMLRYMAVVDHMKEASIPLKASEWDSAIAYAGRCIANVSATEVESALHIWREMEQEAGVKGGRVTFNILFDIATKAGKLVLAEMILDEMQRREVAYDDYSYKGIMFYQGVKGNGEAIRTTYREMVEAGHIVDIVVLDCVISSLIRAGELPAAEQVYERMKDLAHRQTGKPKHNSDYRVPREFIRILDTAAQRASKRHKCSWQLQSEQCLAPDLRTFCILIGHHACVTGELGRVAALVEDMRTFDVPLEGRIMLRIFKGFAFHGGTKYTSWTRQRLELVWASLLSMLDKEMDDVHLGKRMVVWVVRAFERCCGEERAFQIWEVLRNRWTTAGEETKRLAEHQLRNLLQDRVAAGNE